MRKFNMGDRVWYFNGIHQYREGNIIEYIPTSMKTPCYRILVDESMCGYEDFTIIKRESDIYLLQPATYNLPSELFEIE